MHDKTLNKMNNSKRLEYVVTRILNDFFEKEVEITRLGNSVNLELPNDFREKRPIILFSDGEYAKATSIKGIKAFDKKVKFSYPNLTSLYLSKIKKSHSHLVERWNILKDHIKSSKEPEILLDSDYQSELYDYIEMFQSVIVNSYAAIESFSNLTIPDNFEILHKRKRDKEQRTYRKANIQRYWSLSEKIEWVLPLVFNTKKVAQKTIDSFKNLEKLRHIIIHNKDKKYQEVFANLFNPDLVNDDMKSPFNIIQHFSSSNVWVNANVPYGFNDNKLAIMPISDFDALVEEIEIE
jgi:hypothetical protein